jgi:hypothetical protein
MPGPIEWPFDFYLARRELRHVSGTGDIVVTNLDWPERAGRPVIAARLGVRGGLPGGRHTGPTPDGHYSFLPEKRFLDAGFEWWVVNDGRAVRPERRGQRLDFAASNSGWYVLVGCDARECWAMHPFHLRP